MTLIIFLVILRILSNSFSSVFQKKLALRLNANYINFLAYLILAIFCLIFYKFFNFSNTNVFLFALISGLFGAIGNAFQIKALKDGELSILVPINSYKIIFSLIFGFFFLKEIPSIRAFLGVILIIFGSYFIFNTTKEGFSLKFFKRKDVIYRLVAVLFTSLEAIFIKKIIVLSSSITALFLWAGFSMLFSLLFMKIRNYKFEKVEKNFLGLILLLSSTMGLMQLCTNYLFKIMEVGLVLSLFQLSSILSVFLGYKYFKEKNIFKKLIGCLIMIFGAVLIVYVK